MSRQKSITSAGRRRKRQERAAAGILARSKVYALLARALRYPYDELFTALRDGRWAAEMVAAARAAGLEPCDPFLAELRRLTAVLPEELAELRGWHTILFSSGSVCQHQESDYAASHVFQKTDLMADVAGFYAAFGLRVSSVHRELADFLGAELEFLYVAGWKEASALRQGNRAAAAICRQAQEKFLAEHLGVWIGRFREKMERNPAGPFYVLLARLVESFVKAQGITAQPAPPPCLDSEPFFEQSECARCL